MVRSRLFALGGLVAALSATTALGVRAQVGAPPRIVAAANGPRREGHPELRRALNALQRARTNLQNAARDFGGHRAKAEQLTEQAIQEVQAALNSDKT